MNSTAHASNLFSLVACVAQGGYNDRRDNRDNRDYRDNRDSRDNRDNRGYNRGRGGGGNRYQSREDSFQRLATAPMDPAPNSPADGAAAGAATAGTAAASGAASDAKKDGAGAPGVKVTPTAGSADNKEGSSADADGQSKAGEAKDDDPNWKEKLKLPPKDEPPTTEVGSATARDCADLA